MESFTLNNHSIKSFDFNLTMIQFNDNVEPNYTIQNGTDKFASGFYPWADYVFGSILFVSGEIFYPTDLESDGN